MEGGYLNTNADPKLWDDIRKFLKQHGVFQKEFHIVIDIIRNKGINAWNFIDQEVQHPQPRLGFKKPVKLEQIFQKRNKNNDSATSNEEETQTIINEWLDSLNEFSYITKRECKA